MSEGKTGEEGTNGDLRIRWWLRLQRAFQVPDLITDANARTVIVGAIVDRSDIPTLGVLRPFADAILSVVLDLAETGGLDHFFVDSELSHHLSTMPVGDAYRGILTVARDQPGFPQFSSSDAWTGLTEMVEWMLGRVRVSVQDQPFEAALGSYFSLADLPVPGTEAAEVGDSLSI